MSAVVVDLDEARQRRRRRQLVRFIATGIALGLAAWLIKSKILKERP